MEKKYTFAEFMDIIRQLRSENGCPWDREQTHESLKKCMLEEAYESVEAIDNQDTDNLCEELGDMLLQIALHAAIAEEKKEFTIEDVIQGVSTKMIRRHPHVFSDSKADTSEEVLQNWEEIKKQEKKEANFSEGMLRVAKALPANIRAEKVQKKAAKAGMDFKDYNQVLDKVYEELEELKKAKESSDLEAITEEFGDLMFTVINLSRFLLINAENSLTNATNKFINRFVDVECLAAKEGRSLAEMSDHELDALWGQVKKLK